MEKTSVKIRMLYPELGKAEKKIVDWIENNPGKIISMSIVELAEQCDCSEATIVRFSKKLGFSGYQGLKIAFASERNSLSTNTNISETDSTYEIYNKVCNDIYYSLEMTKKSLDADSLTLAANTICNANKIVIIGLGNSSSVAMDMSHKLLRIGLNAIAYSDNHMQVIAVSHLTEKDVVIAISHSGSSKDIVDALSIAQKCGAKTISITNAGKSPINKVSDILLRTSSPEVKYNILALNSRIAQLAIIDALYYDIAIKHSSDVLDSIKQTELSLLSKKY